MQSCPDLSSYDLLNFLRQISVHFGELSPAKIIGKFNL
jgi:hypothetical protein